MIKKTGFWRVKINADGKLKDRCFETLEKAITFRKNKAKELFGEFVNKCETDEIKIIIPKHLKNRKVKITIEIDPELEELEKEFENLIK